jgi:CheY-like chemotaxis protein
VAPGEGRRVLVVDDDALVRAGIQVVLEGLSYSVLAADGGEAAP